MNGVVEALNVLSVEARRKHPKLKEAAERGMLLKRPEAVLLPLLLALETREEKLVGLGLGGLQKMLGFCSVAELGGMCGKQEEGGTGRSLVGRLEEAAVKAGEAVQLRVLQTLVTLLMGRDLPESELRAGLGLCCTLATGSGAAASGAVASVAQAALRQAVALCAAHEPLAAELVSELCATACGEPAPAAQTLHVDALTALELVEGISSKGSAVLLPPLVHRLLGVEKTVRGMRALLRLVQRIVLSGQAEETEVLLVKVCRMLGDSAECSPAQAMMLELVQGLLVTPGLLAELYERYDVAALHSDGRVGLAATLVRALAKAGGLVWRWPAEELGDEQLQMVGRLLDSGGNGAPVVSRGRVTRLVVMGLEAVSDALRDAPPKVRGSLLAASWPSLLGALGLLLSKATSGTVLAGLCVDSLVSLIATCASVGETSSAPRDALVNALVKSADEEGEQRQIIATVGLLRASRAAQGLGAASWYSVLGLLLRVMRKRPEEELDVFTDDFAEAVAKETCSSGGGDSAVTAAAAEEDSDLQRLVRSVRSLPRDTRHLAVPERSTIVAALCKLSQSTLHGPIGAARMWPLDRLCEVLLWNDKEADNTHLWEDVEDHLASAASHSMPMVRERGAAALLALCSRAQPSHGLALLSKLCGSSYGEVRLAGLRGLERVLRRGGGSLSEEAWTGALAGLGSVASVGKRDEVAMAFKLVQLVVEELLPSLQPPSLIDVLCSHVLLPFAAQLVDSSAALSVPTLVWSVAHHLSREGLHAHWGPLLRLLSCSARDDEREEVRAGALRTLFKLSEMHQWPQSVVDDYTTNVLSPLLADLARLSAASSSSEAWLATVALAVIGAVPLQPLDAVLTALLASVLTAPLPPSIAATSKTYRTSNAALFAALAQLLRRPLSAEAVWNRAGLPALSALTGRALAECVELQHASTSSSRFANYFVLCDSVRALIGAAQELPSFLCVLLRDAPQLLDDSVYRSASILFDPVKFKASAPAPLTAAVLAALEASRHNALASVAMALALAACVGLRFEPGPAALLLATEGLPFPSFPADPPSPFVARPAYLPLARGVLAAVVSQAAGAAPSAFPVLCCVLGVCVRTAELSENSVAAFEASLPAELRGAALQSAVDVCHAALIWEGLSQTLAARLAERLARPPLRGPQASHALLAVASPVTAAVLLRLAAERLTPGAAVLTMVRGMLRDDSLSPQLLEALRLLRAPRAAWGAGDSVAGGEELSHLVLLYDDLVHACACAEQPVARLAAAQCLLLVGKLLKQ